MANLNKVFLIGNLTRDPELRYTPNGMAVAEFGMAINRRWKGQDGERRDEVCFVDVQAWGRQAELISEYCRKGRSLFVEGRLTYDSWEGKDGQKRSRLRVTAENFQFLGEGAPNAQPADGKKAPRTARRPAETTAEAPAAPEAPEDVTEPPADYQIDDDIPF